MVRRKQAGFSQKQLAVKARIRLHHLRRWEFDWCLPSQAEWDHL
jgi:transcriptional regulator with XRE-family HTH domain